MYLINRSKRFRAAKTLVDSAEKTPNIKIITDTVAASFNGEGKLESISIKNTETGNKEKLNVSGAIVDVGTEPESDLAKACGVETDENGFIKTDEHMRTDKIGFFAAGDVRTTPLRQVITAAADGAVAAVSAASYINSEF